MGNLLTYLPIFIATGVASYISLIDIREMRIPNRVLLPGTLVTILSMFLVGFIDGSINRALIALLGGTLSLALFFLIHLLSPTGLGMGDVKFSALIGSALSWISFPLGLIGLGISFIASSLFSLIIFVVKRKSLKRVIPFAPFMLAGLLFVELGLFV